MFDFTLEKNVVPEDAQSSTGHAFGQVTINAAKANSVDREQMREDMNEFYRTLIGYFSHEVGHYYWDQLVATDESTLALYRELFGDERKGYKDALQRHYDSPDENWREQFGFSLQAPNVQYQSLCVNVTIDPYQHTNFDDIQAQYLPFTFAVNNHNQSIGQSHLSPFVIVPAVRKKLNFNLSIITAGVMRCLAFISHR